MAATLSSTTDAHPGSSSSVPLDTASSKYLRDSCTSRTKDSVGSEFEEYPMRLSVELVFLALERWCPFWWCPLEAESMEQLRVAAVVLPLLLPWWLPWLW